MFAKYHPIHYYLNINNLVKDPAEVSLHSKRDDGIVVYCYGYLTNCLVFIPFCKNNEVQTLSSCTGDAGESYRDVSILNDSILITNRIHTLYDFEAPKENRNFDVFTKTTTAYNIYTESRWSADTINYTENYNVRIHSEDFYSYRKKDKLMSVPWDN